MRTPVIAANWKMFKTTPETKDFLSAFAPLVSGVNDVDMIIAPPFTSLSTASEMARGTAIRISAQDIYFEKEGAYTGEISSRMLVDCGCSHVIVGHSERRQIFKEDDVIINKKIKASLEGGLEVIFCIGETLEERESGKTFDVIRREVEKGLEGIGLEKIIVAYEPVWAIGTGKNATPQQAQEVHAFIRELLRKHSDMASGTRILYGGSVKPDNIATLMSENDIDGALVGGASLDAVSFSKIVKFKE